MWMDGRKTQILAGWLKAGSIHSYGVVKSVQEKNKRREFWYKRVVQFFVCISRMPEE